jgi:hypothetical protein
MWQDVWKEMGLPQTSLSKFDFEDGQPKIYDEKTPLKEGQEPQVGAGKVRRVRGWSK